MLGSPCGGRELWQALDGCIGESWQHGGEIFTDEYVDSSGGFDDGQDGGHAWSCFYMSDVDPVAAAKCDGAHRVPVEIVG